ncbi:hypothetical protein RJ641_022776 [Dillenia turbinata]|uniref:Uncharacterized protein n=1 Tax=Dillenia turbinata TaxID=194707 RepID=A0AAN8UD59_9MAGN
MAGGDSQKQFLTLIRDFATEKSEGGQISLSLSLPPSLSKFTFVSLERRISGPKKRIAELSPLLKAANADLEEPKRRKETAEQELKGFEVELNLNETLNQTIEARISLIQDEISAIGSDLETLKTKENASRDEFLSEMYKLNAEIRNFHKNLALTFSGDECVVASTEDKLTDVISQLEKEEQDYQVVQKSHEQIKQELSDLEAKITLTESIAKETKEVQDLTRYSFVKYHGADTLNSDRVFSGELLGGKMKCPDQSKHIVSLSTLQGKKEQRFGIN